jgi:hypothetical protein
MALSQTRIQSMLSPHFPGERGRVLLEAISSAHADILTISAAFTALVTKLNADTGVADANYVAPTIANRGI